MKTLLRRTFATALFLVVAGLASLGFADKASVRIEAPESAQKGSEITIRIMVTHSGNSFAHYVDGVVVEVNGQQVHWWKYSAFDRPESESFTREFRYTVSGPTEITAKANCNLHGSAGPAEFTVKVE